MGAGFTKRGDSPVSNERSRQMNKVNTVFLIVLLLLTAMFFFPFVVNADIYSYVDKNGTTHFVDDLGRVPAEYRDQVTIREEKPEGSPPAGEAPKAVDRSGETPEEARTKRILEELEETKGRDEEKAQEQFEKSLVTKVTIRGHQVLVPVTLGYGGKEIQASLILDTGTAITTIYLPIADRLNLPRTSGVHVWAAGGKTLNAGVGKLDYVRVGPYEVKEVETWVVFPPGPSADNDGSLGMNVLKDLDYNVDFENQEIRWKQ